MKNAVVIGAGIGGLALAIRLQAAGISTTVVEARDRPGGRAYVWKREGFTFDAGPTVITDPSCLAELWDLSGHRLSDDVDLLPVTPFYRLQWPDGTTFDYSNDEEALGREIAALNPADVEGYQRFLDYSEAVYAEGYVKLGAAAFLDFKSMLSAAPALARQQAWKSVYARVSDFIANKKLREAFSFHTLLVGGNPMATSAIYALIHKLEKDGGVWYARGGTNRLVTALATHFERLGGTTILGDAVTRIHTRDNRCTAVTLASGLRIEASAIACNSDVMHSYRDLLDHPRGTRSARQLERKSWTPSLFVLHLGVRGGFPDLPHHMILFGERYGALLDDIYKRGVIADDFALYLHHPSATDASVAPRATARFMHLSPSPTSATRRSTGRSKATGFPFASWTCSKSGWCPELADRIVTCHHYAPDDFAADLAAHQGSAFSLSPTLMQSAFFRTHNRDDVIDNLYFVGAGTHPGAGIPGVVGSAKATAALITADAKAR